MHKKFFLKYINSIYEIVPSKKVALKKIIFFINSCSFFIFFIKRHIYFKKYKKKMWRNYNIFYAPLNKYFYNSNTPIFLFFCSDLILKEEGDSEHIYNSNHHYLLWNPNHPHHNYLLKISYLFQYIKKVIKMW